MFLPWLASLSCLLVLLSSARSSVSLEGRRSQEEFNWPLHMPRIKNAAKHNDYRCRASKLPSTDNYIVSYEPRADPTVAHHMLVFGCSALRSGLRDASSWTCKSSTVCSEFEAPTIIYAWALNASGFQLPDGVGQKVGPGNNIKYVVVQIHYGEPETAHSPSGSSEEDPLALILHMTQKRQQYVSGVYLIGSGSPIPAGKDAAYADNACQFMGPKTITPIAFRTHAHAHSTLIVGYVGDGGDNWREIGFRSPQDPQAFYPVTAGHDVDVHPGEWLASRCVYNTSATSHSIHMGPNSEDEMCNFYIMYYTTNDGRSLIEDDCWNTAPKSVHYPPLPVLPPSHNSHHHHDHGMGGGDDDPVVDDKEVPQSSEDGETIGHGDDGDDEKSEEGEDNDYICPTSVSPTAPSTRCPVTTPTAGPPPTTTTTATVATEERVEDGETPPTMNDRPQTTNPPPFPDAGMGEEGEGGVALDDDKLDFVLAEDWPFNGVDSPQIGVETGRGGALGQVSSVTVGGDGSVLVLHRGPRVWDYSTFTFKNVFVDANLLGPIATPTLLKFSSSGTLQQAWGAGIFYLPHSLTIDHRGNLWVTDVALHQVFMFSGVGVNQPSLTLGHTLLPGSKPGYFCKPADVAVASSGTFYVADGYCNSRIVQYSETGTMTQIIGDFPIAGLRLFVPHSLALSPNEDTLYVADRENHRILAFGTSKGGVEVFSSANELGRVFAVAFSGVGTGGWPMVTLNENSGEGGTAAYGLSLDSHGNPQQAWGVSQGFSKIHDLAVDPVSKAVYVTELKPPRIWKFIPVTPTNQVTGIDVTTAQPTTTAEQPSITTGRPTLNADHPTDKLDSTTTATTTATTTPTTESQPTTSKTTATTTPINTQSTDAGSSAAPTTEDMSATTPEAGEITDATTTSADATPETDITTTATTDTALGTKEGDVGSATTAEPVSENGSHDSAPDVASSDTVHLPDTTALPPATVEDGGSSDKPSHYAKSKSKSKVSTPAYHYGLFAAIFAITALILVVVIGILKEHRYCRFGLKKLSRKAKETKAKTPRDALNSLLGPSKLGFSRLRTYDSDSEVEEFPIFSRV